MVSQPARASRLLIQVRAGLEPFADPERARHQQAYMKSTMPFYGVAAIALRTALRPVFQPLALNDAGSWRDLVLELWRPARFREERYAAIELTADRRAHAFQDMDALAMYEEMVVAGAWWDLVDPIATRRLGEVLRAEPRKARRTMLDWARTDNIWKRRSAILCQLHFRGETDLDLLHRTIQPSIESREFFLAKAIGWALRHYARTDPEEVRRFVAANADRLQPLSRREALKHLGT